MQMVVGLTITLISIIVSARIAAPTVITITVAPSLHRILIQASSISAYIAERLAVTNLVHLLHHFGAVYGKPARTAAIRLIPLVAGTKAEHTMIRIIYAVIAVTKQLTSFLILTTLRKRLNVAADIFVLITLAPTMRMQVYTPAANVISALTTL
jgi:hypothetical protein